MRLTVAIGLMLASAALAQPDEKERSLLRVLERFAVKETAEPEWAKTLGAPRFRVALLADIHLSPKAGREARLKRALAAVAKLKPDFAVLLGDNVNLARTAEHARLKRLVDAGLDCPWFAIKGDNDAREYTTVFGSTHWSFVYGGVHFLGTGLDIDAEGKGIGRFAERTYTWLGARLKAHATRPTIVFQHEPAMPPSFLDAPKFTAFVARHPQVRAVIHGHLHRDLELKGRGRVWWTLPAVGPNPRHGFKVLHVHEDGVVARTWEDRGAGYVRVSKWQRARWRDGVRLAKDAPRTVGARVVAPAVETVFDPSLETRWKLFERLIRPKKGK